MPPPKDPIKYALYIERQRKAMKGKQAWNKGKAWDEETKLKISDGRKGKGTGENNYFYGKDKNGEKNPMFGKHHTEETKEKIREKHMGMPSPRKGVELSDETKQKISETRKSLHLTGYWKGKKLSPETIEKIKQNHADVSGEKHPLYGKPLSEETKKKIRKSHLNKYDGENNPNWKGGTSFGNYCPKFNKNFISRVRQFFENTCVECGKTKIENKNRNMCVHHVVEDKNACCDSETSDTRYFVTLCMSCHATLHSNPNPEKMNYYIYLIKTKYGGKCWVNKDMYE